MKSLYYQFVNFIQTMEPIWFICICLALVGSSLICIMKFYKAYNGTQKKFEKLSLLILSVLSFAIVIYLTSIR